VSGLPEPVLIVGTGLIGTSLALSLRRRDVVVWLADRDPDAVSVAVARGAGEPVPDEVWGAAGLGAAAGVDGARRAQPGLVVVAVPPAVTAAVVADGLRRFPGAIVTDVASVKVPIHRALVAAGVDASRYVGGHPMAGREVSGPAAARADLIDDRPWVITPHPGAVEAAIDTVQELALSARALPIVMPAAEHDRAVAVVSHTPQILSSLLAARLLDSSDTVVSIAGQGLRDMTRIAASDADLWVEILAANATPVAAVLGALRADLDALLHALGSIDQGGQDVLVEALRRGNAGRDRVPGKHGARPSPTAVVPVAVPDQPGELGRLFAAVAEAGYSVEDVRIEHVLGRPTGVVEITVGEVSADPLSKALGEQGWDVRA
jgi:prephenate dehydrogenase